jgi:DNA-binding response OmpR family regulator
MPRIFILEDEPLIAAMLRDWLAELGCETLGPASSVSDALNLVGELVADAAILDVSLPDGECYEVADELRRRGVPFAFATGYGAGKLAPPFAGALVLSKPFSFEAVRSAIAKLLDSAAHNSGSSRLQRAGDTTPT